jgi:hypothetical protein
MAPLMPFFSTAFALSSTSSCFSQSDSSSDASAVQRQRSCTSYLAKVLQKVPARRGAEERPSRTRRRSRRGEGSRGRCASSARSAAEGLWCWKLKLRRVGWMEEGWRGGEGGGRGPVPCEWRDDVGGSLGGGKKIAPAKTICCGGKRRRPSAPRCWFRS